MKRAGLKPALAVWTFPHTPALRLPLESHRGRHQNQGHGRNHRQVGLDVELDEGLAQGAGGEQHVAQGVHPLGERVHPPARGGRPPGGPG